MTLEIIVVPINMNQSVMNEWMNQYMKNGMNECEMNNCVHE